MFSPDFWKFLQVVRGGVADKADWVANCCAGKCPWNCIYCSPAKLKGAQGKKIQRGCDEIRLRRLDSSGNYFLPKHAVKKHIKTGDVIQMPSSHDITSKKMARKIAKTIKMILAHTQGVVVVHSKMSLEVAEVLGEELHGFQSHNLIFQITIGTTDPTLMSAIEPKAPGLKERVGALEFLYTLGFKTSVSCTPALSTDVLAVYRLVERFVRVRFHVGALRGKGKNVARNAMHGARGKNTTPAKIHPGNHVLQAVLEDWVESHPDCFTTIWAKDMLRLEKRFKRVVCERDVYILADDEEAFCAPRYTLQEAM